jgi:pantoate kinase
METASVAFCPGHISGYFRPVRKSSPAESGSMGAGIVIHEGVTARVARSKETLVRILRTGPSGEILEQIPDSPPVRYAAEALGISADITTRCRLPISAGFGLSAAALLSTITAANAQFSLGLTEEECSSLAHESEVIHMTGLGDVSACQAGGIDCRKGPGIHAEIVRFYDLPGPVYAVCFGPLPSPGILGSGPAMEQVTRAFPNGCPSDGPDLFRLSRRFAEASGLITPEVKHALTLCDARGIPASMTMLGNGVFALGEDAGAVLQPLGPVYRLELAREGARLVDESIW